MNTFQQIDSFGFHPDLVAATLSAALGDGQPRALLCQMETDLDSSGVFRHFTVIAVTDHGLVHLHLDEEEESKVAITTSVIAKSAILAVHVRRVITAPEADATPASEEIVIEVNHQENRRMEIEPVRCMDPNCTADHGHSAVSSPEDTLIRFSAAADGAEAMAAAERFATELQLLVGRVR